MINCDSGQLRQAMILDNQTTSIVVVGNVTGWAHTGDAWELADYHLADGSAALDNGRIAGAPAQDIEGTVRPGADGRVDIGAYEALSAYKPTADSSFPMSQVTGLPALSPGRISDSVRSRRHRWRSGGGPPCSHRWPLTS